MLSDGAPICWTMARFDAEDFEHALDARLPEGAEAQR